MGGGVEKRAFPEAPGGPGALPALPCSGLQPLEDGVLAGGDGLRAAGAESGRGGGVDQRWGTESQTGPWVGGSAAFLTAPLPPELMKGSSRFRPLLGPCQSCHLGVWVERLGRGQELSPARLVSRDAPARCPWPFRSAAR